MAVDLPADVDLEEQRMLLAAMTGEQYRGRLPDFASDPRYAPRALSPGAAQREHLRQEQDAAYHESLAADRRKAADAEAAAAAAAAGAAAAAAEAARAERAAREAVEAKERRMREKQAALPGEPPADAADSLVMLVRMPGGGRLSRRFRQGDRLEVRAANDHNKERVPASPEPCILTAC
jgi:hypothetical protein